MLIAIVFSIAYFGFMFGYPLLQLWTLFRCRAWWRAAAVICLILTVPLYVWAWQDWLDPKNEASLMSLVFAMIGTVPLLSLLVITTGYESSLKRSKIQEQYSYVLEDENRAVGSPPEKRDE